jgi:hypothetical protein
MPLDGWRRRALFRETGLLLRGLLGIDDGSGRLLSAEHFQNLLRGPRAGVGLVRVGWLRLARGISAVHFRLCRGLGLIVGVVVGVIGVIGVILRVVLGAVVSFGIRGLHVRRLRDDGLLVERLRQGKTVWRHYSWIVLIDVRGSLGFCPSLRFGAKDDARNHGGIGTRTEDYVVERGAVEQGRQNVPRRSRSEVSDDSLRA